MVFKYSFVLLLLFFIPVDLYILCLRIKNKRKALNNYGNAGTIEKEISNLSYKKVYFKWGILTLACVFLTIALARPVKMGAEVKRKQKVIDVIFLVDISKSMLAEDEKPNRIEKAKKYMKNIIIKYPQNSFSLVLFSNNAFVYCPSTIDTNTIVEFTDEISVDLSSLPGTSLKKAFELIRNSLIKNKEKEKTIILLSDGETHAPVDNNDLEWFTKNKIKIYAIALGSEEGAKIPISENNKTIEYKKDSSGKEIITKRNTELLKNISSKTNAIFIENEKQLPALISKLNQLKKENKEIKQKVIKEELYYYFLIPALFLFLMELLVLERKDVFI